MEDKNSIIGEPQRCSVDLNYEKTHLGGARSDEISAKSHLQGGKYHFQRAKKNKNDGSLHQKHTAEPEKLIE